MLFRADQHKRLAEIYEEAAADQPSRMGAAMQGKRDAEIMEKRVSGSVTRYGLLDTDGAPAKMPAGGLALMCGGSRGDSRGHRVRRSGPVLRRCMIHTSKLKRRG